MEQSLLLVWIGILQSDYARVLPTDYVPGLAPCNADIRASITRLETGFDAKHNVIRYFITRLLDTKTQ